MGGDSVTPNTILNSLLAGCNALMQTFRGVMKECSMPNDES